MTSQEKILRDIATLIESIQLNRADLSKPELTGAERAGIIKHSALLMQELAGLIGRVNSSEQIGRASCRERV